MEKFDGYRKVSHGEAQEWAKKEKKLPKTEDQPKTMTRMGKKEAENEAFWLKCIVQSGHAENYNEAEALWQNIDPLDTSEQAMELWSAITQLYNEKTTQYQDYLSLKRVSDKFGYFVEPEYDCEHYHQTHNPELKDEDIHNCFACRQPLKPVFPDMHQRGASQYENALRISFDGSYEMFIDPPFMFIDEDEYIDPDEFTKKGMLEDPLSLIICHDCAHDLCNKVPWIKDLLDAENAHSHSANFEEENEKEPTS